MVNPRTGRVHTTYGQAVAVTGRLSSNDPNLQNIPVRTPEGRRIREAFVAPKGNVIVSADYSQVELRIMAHISGDQNLLRAFAAGEDIHRATAAEVFGRSLAEVTSEERRYAKVINFGLIYGMSAFGLAQQLGLERATAQAYISSYFTRYPGVARYMEDTRKLARDRGYVETVLGRRLWLPEIKSSNPARRSGAERAAINAPMQGTAADLIKLAMIAVQGWLERGKLATKLIMQVHDELVLEVPEGELDRVRAEIPKLMSGVRSSRSRLSWTSVRARIGKKRTEPPTGRRSGSARIEATTPVETRRIQCNPIPLRKAGARRRHPPLGAARGRAPEHRYGNGPGRGGARPASAKSVEAHRARGAARPGARVVAGDPARCDPYRDLRRRWLGDRGERTAAGSAQSVSEALETLAVAADQFEETFTKLVKSALEAGCRRWCARSCPRAMRSPRDSAPPQQRSPSSTTASYARRSRRSSR